MSSSQNVQLNISGLSTAGNDFTSSPPGALDDATNISIDEKNIATSRRGFSLFGDAISVTPTIVTNRITSFSTTEIADTKTEYEIIRLSDNTLERSAGPGETVGSWSTWPGTFVDPADDAKLRFFESNRRKYVLTSSGPKLLDLLTTGDGGNVSSQAGVPKALDLVALVQDAPGFFTPNDVVTPLATATAGSNVLTNISDLSSITTGQYISAAGSFASAVIQSLTYTAVTVGSFGNSITIQYQTIGPNIPGIGIAVIGTAIIVTLATNTLGNSVSTANQVLAAINASSASSLVTVIVSGTGTTVQTPTGGAVSLTGGADGKIPLGTKVDSIQDSAPIVTQTGSTTAGSTSITALASNAGIVAGVLVAGDGIPDGAKVISISGTGPYTVVISSAAYETATGVTIAFTSAPTITMTNLATGSGSSSAVTTFYSGSQIGYRLLFVGRDAINSALSYGSPTGIAIATNIYPTSASVSVTTNLPQNLTMGPEVTLYVQLYRSDATADATVPPLDQMQLVYEAPITSADITAGRITILDQTPDSLKGIPLYTGSDRDGILQANDPPPLCKDATPYRDLVLYANVTSQPSLKLTLLGVSLPGGSGLQAGDVLTLTPSGGSAVTFTATASTPASPGQFQVITSGTPAQNITDTTNNLISAINYAPGLLPSISPVTASLLSGTSDLPGQILLTSVNYTEVSISVSAHGATAWTPSITPSDDESLISEEMPNTILISKSGEGIAVPAANSILIGDSSYPIIRILALREYVFVLKADGIYRITGLTPDALTASLFDNTTRIVGAETAVVLANAVWMLSNQGVVSVSDTGVQIRSEPIKDVVDRLTGPLLNTTRTVAFAVGYETAKKYILSAPDNTGDTFAKSQLVFNYLTSAWTTWDRESYAMNVAQNEDRLYVGNALSPTVSRERNEGDDNDFCDEDLFATITDVTGAVVTLDSIDGISLGDMLVQSSQIRATVIAIDGVGVTVTVEDDTGVAPGAVTIKTSIHCGIQWKPVVNGNNPAQARQYAEGILFFKNTHFNFGTIGFFTDADNSIESVPIEGQAAGEWGFFTWGDVPWGGIARPYPVRFYIPQSKQYASQLVPILTIQNALSSWTVQGVSISANSISQEVPSVVSS